MYIDNLAAQHTYKYIFGTNTSLGSLSKSCIIMVMMNPDICEWQNNKRTSVTDESKCVKECYCSVRNISKMNIIIAFISVRCILGRHIKTKWWCFWCLAGLHLSVSCVCFYQMDEVLAFSLKLSLSYPIFTFTCTWVSVVESELVFYRSGWIIN